MINLSRILIVYAVAIPVALLLGRASSLYGLGEPDLASFAVIGLVLFVLALPLLLHSHRPILLFCWNATLTAFFLPGAPAFWLVMAFRQLPASGRAEGRQSKYPVPFSSLPRLAALAAGAGGGRHGRGQRRHRNAGLGIRCAKWKEVH